MRLPRGIFVKLVTIFLIIGLIPLLGMSIWTYSKARDRMTATVVEYWLVRQARETAATLDSEVQEMRALIRSWADDAFLAERLSKLGSVGTSLSEDREVISDFLRRRRNYHQDLEFLMLVAPDGRIIATSMNGSAASSTPGSSGGPDDPFVGKHIGDIMMQPDESQWIDFALNPEVAARNQDSVPISTHDWHISSCVRLAQRKAPWTPEEGVQRDPEEYSLGVAGTVLGRPDPTSLGALVGFFNWGRIQGVLDRVTERFNSPDDPLKEGARYPSGYPFLFASNLDTIIAHRYTSLIGNSLSRNHGLASFRERMAKATYGAYEYEYPPGVPKISGFAHTRSPANEGFGWTVGVGIDHDEIYADVNSLRDFMIIAALIVTGMVILMAATFSHRITEPITRLIAYTEGVARGNLDDRVDIRTNDEIAVLADSFNRMTEDLKESNQRLIKAEKNAAWQEMARQVAHEIKNPLTPIMLSAQQMARAHEDRHPMFDDILQDSVAVIVEQCESLRKIAADFASFASFPDRKLNREHAVEIVRGAVDLYRPRMDAEITVEFRVEIDESTEVLADKAEMRRVFLNLFNNAMEAMEAREDRDGVAMQLIVSVTSTRLATRDAVRIDVEDTGVGIPEANRERLFEPYFSTRTAGTGLGLAICKRIVEEHGGTLTVESKVGVGTTFSLVLPTAPRANPEDRKSD